MVNQEVRLKHIQDVRISLCCSLFYRKKSNVVEHFGHGRFYRIAYNLNIKDHLPESLKRQSHIVGLNG